MKYQLFENARGKKSISQCYWDNPNLAIYYKHIIVHFHSPKQLLCWKQRWEHEANNSNDQTLTFFSRFAMSAFCVSPPSNSVWPFTSPFFKTEQGATSEDGRAPESSVAQAALQEDALWFLIWVKGAVWKYRLQSQRLLMIKNWFLIFLWKVKPVGFWSSLEMTAWNSIGPCYVRA